MAKATLELKGDKELMTLFAKLPPAIQKQVLAKGLPAAGTVIEKEMDRRVPVGPTGNLKKSLGWKLVTRDGTMAVAIGPMGKRGAHAHLIEFGTAPHETRVDTARTLADGDVIFGPVTQHPGSPAKPFIFPAFEAKKAEAVHEIAKAAQEALRNLAR